MIAEHAIRGVFDDGENDESDVSDDEEEECGERMIDRKMDLLKRMSGIRGLDFLLGEFAFEKKISG